MGRRPKNKTPGIRLSAQRDIKILLFLWKWKVATSSVLMNRFFAGLSPFTSYRRLWTLEKAGCIESRADATGQKHIWTLGKRGYDTIKEYLPYNLKENGYKSECPGHDLLLAAFHLGDWAFGSPSGVGLVSEQQLRRYHFEQHSDWVPRLERHRPDGYTCIPTDAGNVIFGIEVEINPKQYHEYYDVAHGYDEIRIDVLWLVPRASIGRRIREYLSKASSGKWERHSFASFSEFAKLGWGATFDCGKYQGRTIREVLTGTQENQIKTASNLVSTTYTLDVAKTPHKSATSKVYSLGNFSN